jgi:chorismate synthase
MVAFVLADALLEKLGGDSLAEMLPRYAGLRRAQLSDIPIDGEAQIYWPSVSLEDHS